MAEVVGGYGGIEEGADGGVRFRDVTTLSFSFLLVGITILGLFGLAWCLEYNFDS